MPRPKMKILKENFCYFFSLPKPLKHLKKVGNKFSPFFSGGIKKNLKVPMPRPQMKIFKKNFCKFFFVFFTTQNH